MLSSITVKTESGLMAAVKQPLFVTNNNYFTLINKAAFMPEYMMEGGGGGERGCGGQ